MTNFEKITTSSPEELAKFLTDYWDCPFCPVSSCDEKSCVKSTEVWLNKECEEE